MLPTQSAGVNPQVPITTPNNSRGWHSGFQVLSVRQGWSLLLDAGVPETMARSPEPLSLVARSYLRTEQWARTPNLARHIEALVPVLQDAFGSLGRDYGEGQARALYDWMRYYFVDPTYDRVRSWTLLLWRLVHSSAVPLRLSEEAHPVILTVLTKRLGPDAAARQGDLIQQAYRVPLTPEEETLLIIDAPNPDGTFPRLDVVKRLGRILIAERPYLAWKELERRLSAREQELLLAWAREEAMALQMRTDHIPVSPTSDRLP